MLHNNIKKDGSLDTDRFAAALMTKQNTPEYGSTTSLDGKGDSHDSHGMDLDSSLGGRGFKTVQLDIPSQSQNVGLRPSTRAGKGKTSQFKDCITGSELDKIGEGT